MTDIHLTFDGSTQCYARSVAFPLVEATLFTTEDIGHRAVWLRLMTDYQRRLLPFSLHFHHPEELRTLICGLAKAYAQMTNAEEPTHAPDPE